MLIKIPMFQVDAFATKLFTGNPAAVCILDKWLSDEQLQAIAQENNLSETAFLIQNGQGFHIRWFTPRGEVELCGHATLASAYVVFTQLEWLGDTINFQSLGGNLVVKKVAEQFTLDFPALSYETRQSVSNLVTINPKEILHSPYDLVLVYEDEQHIINLQPNLQRLLELPYRGLIITAPSASADIYSRCFYPRHQIPEDPVTGSAHCVLTPYWAKQLGKNKITAIQGLERRGALTCEIQKERVFISGQCQLYLEGHIRI